jgi:hypothetical protein
VQEQLAKVGCIFCCIGCWRNHKITICIGLQYSTIIQLRLLNWILLPYLLRVFFNLNFCLHLFGILFNFSLWLMAGS